MKGLLASSTRSGQLSRFSVVGGAGLVINFLVFGLSSRTFGLSPTVSVIIAFLVAVTSNFSFNRVWTFASSSGPLAPYLAGWWKYLFF